MTSLEHKVIHGVRTLTEILRILDGRSDGRLMAIESVIQNEKSRNFVLNALKALLELHVSYGSGCIAIKHARASTTTERRLSCLRQAGLWFECCPGRLSTAMEAVDNLHKPLGRGQIKGYVVDLAKLSRLTEAIGEIRAALQVTQSTFNETYGPALRSVRTKKTAATTIRAAKRNKR